MHVVAPAIGCSSWRITVTAASIPDVPGPGETYAYSPEDITQMVDALPEPAAIVVMTAGFAGLRRGEIRGMRWENLESGEPLSFYHVSQSVWKSFVTEPKTAKSKAPVPIIGLAGEEIGGASIVCDAAMPGLDGCSSTLRKTRLI